jgi:ArsR family transcriptional regulator
MTDLPLLMSVLSDPTRLGALRILSDGQEHCVCQMMEQLGATQSRMSRHLRTLRSAGLVLDRRDAQWVRYRRNPDLPPQIRKIVEAVVAAAASDGGKARAA